MFATSLEFLLIHVYFCLKRFWEAADDAMMHLWQFKSDLGLFGNTFNGRTGKWINRNAGDEKFGNCRVLRKT